MNEIGQDGRAIGRKRGLGMGLSALLGTSDDPSLPASDTPTRVPIEFLQPSPLQPRRRFTENELAALADSIRAKGVMQPLLVRPAADGGTRYEIVAGERRWRAAQLVGLHELPVLVRPLSDGETLEVALIENVQRQDLSPLEEAEGYRRLIDDFGHTQDALARALGKSRSHIANLLRLLGLPGQVRGMLEQGDLSAGHARALLGARDPEALARSVVARGLNVRQTEALVRSDSARAPSARRVEKDANTVSLERDLSARLGLKVTIRPKGGGGTLRIAFHSLDQLDGLIQSLMETSQR
jgi:ParB family transcriptional regulator, chromosome partitioning protein